MEMKEFIFSNDFYKNIELMVYTTGHEQCKPSHSYGPAVRSSYMIHYIHSGKGSYTTRGKTWHLGPGDFFLMIPGERIYYEADLEDPWVYSWIGLQGVKTEEYLQRTSLLDDLVGHLPDDSKIPEIYLQLQDIYKDENADLLYNASAYSFIYELARDFPSKKDKEPRTTKEYAEMILTYIEQNFDGPITVQSIADRFAIDRSYLHRIFKKEVGLSVKDYIVSLRLANACSFLIYSDISISEVARSVGYEDVLYFSKLFHRKKGISPSEYRIKKRKELNIEPEAVRQKS